MSWKFVNATAIGTSHIKHGFPCQDFSLVVGCQDKLGDQNVIAIVSDGAGSCPNSQLGSRLNCYIAAYLIKRWLKKGNLVSNLDLITIHSWINKIKKLLNQKALKLGLSSQKDLASTFLLAIVSKKTNVFVQIGDGVIVTSNQPKNYKQIFWPDNGEYANSTYFITDELAHHQVQIAFVNRPAKKIALLSDGLQNIALDYVRKEPFSPFFEPIFKFFLTNDKFNQREKNIHLCNFLNSQKVNERTDDDKSVILISTQDNNDTSH